MVEYTLSLDEVFGSLANSTRRDMLKRLSVKEMTISQLARPYKLTFASISKHLKTLEKARLVTKSRHGKEQIVSLVPSTIFSANEYLEFYQKVMGQQIKSLDKYINNKEVK